jgi:proteasome accessory factor A
LYYGLEQAGAMLGVPDDGFVWQSVSQPPRTTRAYIRGRCIQKFASAVVACQWDHITLQGRTGPIKISLLDLFAPEDILRYGIAVDAASTPDDLRKLAKT